MRLVKKTQIWWNQTVICCVKWLFGGQDSLNYPGKVSNSVTVSVKIWRNCCFGLKASNCPHVGSKLLEKRVRLGQISFNAKTCVSRDHGDDGTFGSDRRTRRWRRSGACGAVDETLSLFWFLRLGLIYPELIPMICYFHVQSCSRYMK